MTNRTKPWWFNRKIIIHKTWVHEILRFIFTKSKNVKFSNVISSDYITLAFFTHLNNYKFPFEKAILFNFKIIEHHKLSYSLLVPLKIIKMRQATYAKFTYILITLYIITSQPSLGFKLI